jgi:hypothetical protein
MSSDRREPIPSRGRVVGEGAARRHSGILVGTLRIALAEVPTAHPKSRNAGIDDRAEPVEPPEIMIDTLRFQR